MRAVGLGLLLLIAALVTLWLMQSDPAPAPDPADGGPISAAPEPSPAAALEAAAAAPDAGVGRTEVRSGDAGAAAEQAALAGDLGGTVVDAAGRPIEGATVVFLRRGEAAAFAFLPDHAAPRDAELTTDREGRYVARGLPSGRAWDLCAWHPDYCFGSGVSAQGLAGFAQELPPIRLADGFVLSGRVEGMDAAPLPGAEITLALEGVPEPDDPAARDPLGRRFRLTADERGEFEFAGLGAGAWSARARLHDYGDTIVRQILLIPSQPPPFLALRLGLERAIAGTVVNPEGDPIAGASLELHGSTPGAGPDHRAVSGADGAFAFQGVGEGGWTLSARRAGYLPPRPLKLEDGPHLDLLVEMTPLGGVVGRLETSSGAAPAGATLELWLTMRGSPPYRPGGRAAVAAGADGGFRVDLETAGSYVLLARAPGCSPSWSPIFQVGPRDVDLGLLRLPAAAGLRGRLLHAADGAPVAGASVTLRAAGWTPDAAGQPFAILTAGATEIPPAATRTGPDGGFELLEVLPGAAALSFEHDAIVPLVLAVHPEAGRVADLGTQRAAAACRLLVRGLDGEGRPLAGGTALLQRDAEGAGISTHLLDAHGEARIPGLADGAWWVSVVEGGGLFGRSSERRQTWLRPGESAEIELSLPAPR